MTLNLLRQSRINPKLLAYAQINGNFDYNKTPIAPPGCEVIAFTPPSQRTSWGYHGYKAWYVKPAMHHYRCIQAISETTGRETTVENVQYLPHNFYMPAMLSKDLAIKAAQDLTKALNTPHPQSTFLPPHAQQVAALKHLASIFAEMTNPKAHHVPPPRVPMEQTETKPCNTTTSTMPPSQAFHTQQELQSVVAPIIDTPIHRVNAVYNPVSGNNLEYRQLIRHPTLKTTWLTSAANEFGRLAQGIRDIPGTNNIRFIHRTQVPSGRRVTCGRFVCDIRKQKCEQARTRLTVGGNLIEYPGVVSSPTARQTTYKIHVNDIILTPNAK